MKKYLKIAIAVGVVIIALLNSVYVEKLDARKTRQSVQNFNPREKAHYFWENELDNVLLSAIDLELFDTQLEDAPDQLTAQYGKAVGITSSTCFLVNGLAQLSAPGADELAVELKNGRSEYRLQIKYIFGNAARDATGYFNIDDFENTMDFNAISTELNTLIVQREIAKLDSLSTGGLIKFVGAIEIDPKNRPERIAIVPLKIEATN